VSSDQEAITGIPLRWSARVVDYLSLERNVVLASSAVFLLGFGEELWKRFLPKYLEYLGAPPVAIGLFGTSEDFFDAVYQYPGGWLADRAGRRRAFLVFVGIASVGYLIYLLSPSWPWAFVGLGFAMAWQSMASPAIFAVIGDALPTERRAMGFTLQSMLRRVPMVISPIVGGFVIAKIGVVYGVRAGLASTLLLALLASLIVLRINIPIKTGAPVNMRGVWRSFHGALKRLLISDIFIRTCEGMADTFVVLYATNVLGVTIAEFGLLVAIQMSTSILVYIPAGVVADRIGRKPCVIATFVCFALFPVAVVISSGFASLTLAFIIGGLREIGEPSRKTMIVDFAQEYLRARTVGLYYLIRSIAITPSAAIGGLLWNLAPQVPFLAAGMIGFVGTLVFAATIKERHAS
jgi:MFS family permease